MALLLPMPPILTCKLSPGRTFLSVAFGVITHPSPDRFVKMLVIEIFSSVLGLFGLIIGLLVGGKALDMGAA